MRFPSRPGVLLSAIATCTIAAADGSPYIFEIPAERLAGYSQPLGESLQAVLHVPNAARASEMIRAAGAMQVVDAKDGLVTVTFGQAATTQALPDASNFADSFVIDYSAAAVEALTVDLKERHGELPSITELTQFVFDHIDDKTYLATFDLASKVATTGSGDCTEHAVLLTALARATGKAARVVTGVVLIDADPGIQAFGHAWSEIYDGNEWRLADATRLQDELGGGNAYYLPLLTLQNEGPGYSMDMARMVHVQPARVSGIRNAAD